MSFRPKDTFREELGLPRSVPDPAFLSQPSETALVAVTSRRRIRLHVLPALERLLAEWPAAESTFYKTVIILPQ
jgi:hypothetical protein